MTIGSLRQRAVDTALPMETVLAAAHRMATRCVGTLVVVDDEQRPVGMLTDRDLAVRVVAAGSDPSTTHVVDVMSGDLCVIDEHAEIGEALAMMRRRRVRRLPLVDADGRLCGIVSLEDILKDLARTMAEVAVFLQRTTPAELVAR